VADTRFDGGDQGDEFLDIAWQVRNAEGHVETDEIGFGPGRLAHALRTTVLLRKLALSRRCTASVQRRFRRTRGIGPERYRVMLTGTTTGGFQGNADLFPPAPTLNMTML